MTQERICSVDGCVKRHKGRGLCVAHLSRLKRHGDVGTAETRDRRGAPPRGSECRLWKDAPSYNAVHQRIRRDHGKAIEHTCACGERASQWAYLHNDPEQLVDERGRAYSTKPECYVPMCTPCHKRADLARLMEAAA